MPVLGRLFGKELSRERALQTGPGEWLGAKAGKIAGNWEWRSTWADAALGRWAKGHPVIRQLQPNP